MRKVQELGEEESSSEEESDLYLLELKNKKDNSTLEATINVENLPICFRLDTGAQANVLPLEIWEQIADSGRLKQTTKKLTTYTKQQVKLVGEGDLKCNKNGKSVWLKFLVTKENNGAILG